jgi:hypothetical protein
LNLIGERRPEINFFLAWKIPRTTVREVSRTPWFGELQFSISLNMLKLFDIILSEVNHLEHE